MALVLLSLGMAYSALGLEVRECCLRTGAK